MPLIPNDNAALLYQQIIAMIAKQFRIESSAIHPTSRLVEDLYASSLDILEVAMSTNDAFGIKLAPEDLENVRTVGDLCNLAQKLYQR